MLQPSTTNQHGDAKLPTGADLEIASELWLDVGAVIDNSGLIADTES